MTDTPYTPKPAIRGWNPDAATINRMTNEALHRLTVAAPEGTDAIKLGMRITDLPSPPWPWFVRFAARLSSVTLPERNSDLVVTHIVTGSGQ